jgi:hypothetical protein
VLEVTELESELIEGWKINLLFLYLFFVYYTDIQPTQTAVYYTKRRHGKHRILYEIKRYYHQHINIIPSVYYTKRSRK